MKLDRGPVIDWSNLAVHLVWVAWFVALVAGWDRWSAGTCATLLVVGVPLQFWCYAVLHNHMHLPIVRARAAAWIVSRTLGLSVGFAYRGFHVHHFNHHRYDNGPGDWGRPRAGEGALVYCVRSTLTPWIMPWRIVPKVWSAIRTPVQKFELAFDLLLVEGTIVFLCAWRPALGFGWLAALLAAQLAVYAINLAAHDGTDGGDATRLAVTSTSPWYNLLFFNAGHHHAHHLKPQAPWRALPTLTESLTVDRAGFSPLAPVDPRWLAQVAARMSRYDGGACSPLVTPPNSPPPRLAAT